MKPALHGLSLAAFVGGAFLVAQDFCFAKPQTWVELRSPHFVVVSNANEHEARQVAHQFELIRSVFREYVSTNDQPVIIIAAKDEDTLKPLLPESWTKRGSARRAGLYLNGPDMSYVGLRLDVTMNKSAYEPYEPIYHEYVHYLMRRVIPQLPVWLVEGLAEFCGNVQIESNRVWVGMPSKSNLMILREKPLLPFSTLFEVNASSPYYNEENKISIFYAESWALTHYLMARDLREHTNRVRDFIALLRQNVPQTDAASRTIGDPRALERALNEYIYKFAFTEMGLDRPKTAQGDFQARPLSDAESLAVRADFLAHNGQYARAQEMLEESIKLDPKLAASYENMGFVYFQQGKMADAEKWSAQAIALNPQSYRANYYYAWSLLRGSMLDDEMVAKAEASLRTVVKSAPGFTPAYDALAYCLARPGSHQKLDEAYKMVLVAAEQEPRNVHYRIRAVEVLERRGRAEDAIKVAMLAVSMAKTTEEQGAASASLAGARQFQVSQKKMKELREAEASSAPAIEEAARAAALSRDKAGARGPIEILTNTMGVDFNPYVNRVLHEVKQHWYELIPADVGLKRGKVVLEFAILKDGSLVGLKVVGSSGDMALDRPAFGSITASNPFQPLPAEFKGQYLGLRFSFFYNLESERANTVISISPTEMKVPVGVSQQFLATVKETGNAVVKWGISGKGCVEAACGTISALGLYTAPANVPDPPSVTVTATLASDASATAAATVVIAKHEDKPSGESDPVPPKK